jgi:hypothetical protein
MLIVPGLLLVGVSRPTRDPHLYFLKDAERHRPTDGAFPQFRSGLDYDAGPSDAFTGFTSPISCR